MPAGAVITPVELGRGKYRYSYTANGKTATFVSKAIRPIYGQAVATAQSTGARLVDINGDEIVAALRQP